MNLKEYFISRKKGIVLMLLSDILMLILTMVFTYYPSPALGFGVGLPIMGLFIFGMYEFIKAARKNPTRHRARVHIVQPES